MAALNKLAIRGIRSFDDKHVQVIEFYSPLTVIVGHNGSGKTTIIECLKYATTGDLPPNTKGGAFVHDPKMANEKEVKAQVRLRFFNVNRQRMTATRSLQVTTAKTGKLSMKTLEGLLAKTDLDGGDGKRNTISTKCSEMDEEVPLLLGVSKAILENVIFCHQEDSSWPLSEPSALKKKFDDIFEATKYTKALDNIRTIRKERVNELKVDKERLKFLKADKDKAERMRKELEETIRKENAKGTEIADLKQRLDELQNQNMMHYQQATSFNTIFERVETLTGRLEMLKKNRDRMKIGMTELKDTTEDLLHQFRNFDEHVKSIEGKRDRKVEDKRNEDLAIEDHRRRERNLLSTQGALVNNRKIYERTVKEREAAIREVAKNQNFSGYDYSPLEEQKIEEFMDRLHELVRKAEMDLKRIQADGARKERQLQAELDLLSSAKTSAVATKQSKQDQITSLNAAIRAKEANFESVSSVEADISVVENDIAVSEGRRDRLDEEIQNARYDEQVRERLAAVRQKEADRDKINADLSVLNRQADSRAQLSIKRSELESKTAQMGASVQSHAVRFKELVGSDIVTETMEETVTLAVGRKDRELQEAETSAAHNSRSLSQLQTQVQIAKQSLRAKKEELGRLENKIADALEESGKTSVDEAIAEAQTEVNVRNDEINDKGNTMKFYRKVLDMGRSKKRCIGCDRAIHANEKSHFEAYINTRIERCSNDDGSELQEELEQWQHELDKLRAVVPSVEIAKTLKDREIPELERQLAADSVKLNEAQEDVETSRSRVQTAKLATRDLQTLKSASAIISRTVGDIKDLKTDIQRLERDLKSTGSLKTVEEVQREADQISSDIKHLQREQHQLSSEKELKVNTLRSISDELSRKTVRLSELRTKQEKRRMDEAALKEQQEQVVVLQRELKELDAKAAAAVAPWREKNEAIDRYRVERQTTESEASHQVDLYRQSMGQVQSQHSACQNYIAEGNDRKMRENETHLADVRREITNLQTQRNKIDTELSEIQDQISQAQVTRKNIRNNLDYREEIREITKVETELDDLDLDAAHKARSEFNSVYKKKMEEETSVSSQWQVASGVLLQMSEDRKIKERTLKVEYKDIDKQFREQLIKTKTSEVANNDLEKYGKALDSAILRYHAIKMEEINDTIGHLWSKTYQGTDIDTVRIVSDQGATSTGTRKTYNYRVVMVKNDVELDMRGRCSAGQKVLASIVIRLALAESFGQGCGVLALDEPTTNLDQENINALAESLAEIIRERRRQSNFQLIVITHDEGFLQQLAAHDVLEYYWRVSRDSSQKSILERQKVGI